MDRRDHELSMSIDECKRTLRRLELEAYNNLVTALRAQGFLTSKRKKLLDDVCNVLNISVDRHKAEIRRAVNDECLSTIADVLSGPRTSLLWKAEGRRMIPLIPRAVPQTAFTAVADQATPDFSLPIPSFTLPNERVTIVPIHSRENSLPKEQEQSSRLSSSPPVKRIRLEEEKINPNREKDRKELSEPKPSTSSQKFIDDKKSESKFDISNNPSSSQLTDKSISTEPSTSSGISRKKTNSFQIPIKSRGSTSLENPNYITIKEHLKKNENSQTSSINETAPLTPSSESAASPKPTDQTAKRNVVFLQTNSNSQRNITIPQETFKKLISAGTQTNKPITLGSMQKINLNHPTQGKMIVVDLSQQQPKKKALVNEILQATGILTSKTNTPSEESEEEAQVSPIHDISKNSKIVKQKEEESSEPLAPDPNIEGVQDSNVPEPIQYEETMEELIETEVLDGTHSMNIVGEIDPKTGLYSTLKPLNMDNSSSDVSN